MSRSITVSFLILLILLSLILVTSFVKQQLPRYVAWHTPPANSRICNRQFMADCKVLNFCTDARCPPRTAAYQCTHYCPTFSQYSLGLSAP